MRNIQKNMRPAIGEILLKSETFDQLDGQTKQELRDDLVAEQFHLCCYCMGRIEPTHLKTKIEHNKPQSIYPDLVLNYSNLLAACNGNDGNPLPQQHCDTAKGDREISKNPATDNVEALIEYKLDGTICSNNQEFQRDINSVLNLNHPTLIAQRRAMIDSIKDSIGGDFPNRRPGQNQLLNYITKFSSPNEKGQLKPFSQVVIWYLKDRIRRISS